MAKHILILQGHPDPEPVHLCHALAMAYERGAAAAGHEVRQVAIARLDLPFVLNKADYDGGEANAGITAAQRDIAWAEHLIIIFPLWQGGLPARLKAFFEQALRPGFATTAVQDGRKWQKKLTGRSARVVITMGMPALAYRWFYGAHSLKALKRNLLGFVGIKPVRASLFGLVESKPERRQRWLTTMEALGRRGA
ncbi:MAG: NAD(P)H-dependent oxidoreductase [Alphaproteobacteria bacterium]